MIEELLKTLQAIAKKNDDRFRCRIDVGFRNGMLWYHFIAEETADGHTFVDGQGQTIDAAYADAKNNINDACELWGYKQ